MGTGEVSAPNSTHVRIHGHTDSLKHHKHAEYYTLSIATLFSTAPCHYLTAYIGLQLICNGMWQDSLAKSILKWWSSKYSLVRAHGVGLDTN